MEQTIRTSSTTTRAKRRIREKSTRPLGRGPLLISAYDRQRLLRLVSGRQAANLEDDQLGEVEFEVERAVALRPSSIPPDVVTVNSRVRIRDIESGARTEISIVLPANVDPLASCISILDPLGFALFGRRIGDEVRLASETGERRFVLEAIPYQPEAAGDYHL
jgi:regulator of nucleoside diphosphate kinase